MFNNHIKNILLYKKNNFYTYINIFNKKKYLFFLNKNLLFFNNFTNKIKIFNNIIFLNNKNILTINFLNYLKKKQFKNYFNKYRFIYSFFGYINFNYLKNIKNFKNNKINECLLILPNLIFFINKKYKKIIYFFIINVKNTLNNYIKKLNFINKRIKNVYIKNFVYYKSIVCNYNIKKKIFFKYLCKIKNNILIGNIIQCVVFNNLIIKNNINNYLENKSKYNFLYKNCNIIIKCYSPEFLFRVEKNLNFVKPIAGTVDKKNYIKKIYKNKKEISEHLMLLDLGINDIYFNNYFIYFNKIIFAEHHKNIIHLVSEIYYYNNINIIKNMEKIFPAGTLTGAPKNISIKFINFIELEKRNFFSGIFIYFNKYDLESCIIIRFCEKINKILFIKSGAGVIDKSIHLLEWMETVTKKQLFIK